MNNRIKTTDLDKNNYIGKHKAKYLNLYIFITIQ